MGNANTEHSKKLRAETAKKSMQKRIQDPNFKQIRIAGDRAVIERFIAELEKTGKDTRIEQLSALLDSLTSNA